MGETESGTAVGADVSEGEGETGPNWSVINWAIIGVFTALTLIGIALATGLVDWAVAVQGGGDAGTMTVPLYVYLYSGLGALGYVFTKLMAELDEYAEWDGIEELVSMAMRIPAAWILATGIYLFLGEFVDAGSPDVVAGVAFLVGLYVNVALKALGSLADRILGRTP